jgi:hypothetical protein
MYSEDFEVDSKIDCILDPTTFEVFSSINNVLIFILKSSVAFLIGRILFEKVFFPIYSFCLSSFLLLDFEVL